MIDWMFIPTWSLMVLLFVAVGWVVWNFDNEVKDMDAEIKLLEGLLKDKEEKEKKE